MDWLTKRVFDLDDSEMKAFESLYPGLDHFPLLRKQAPSGTQTNILSHHAFRRWY